MKFPPKISKFIEIFYKDFLWYKTKIVFFIFNIGDFRNPKLKNIEISHQLYNIFHQVGEIVKLKPVIMYGGDLENCTIFLA